MPHAFAGHLALQLCHLVLGLAEKAGVLDLLPIMRILRDSEFSGGILPDHVPESPGDPGKLQGYAFAYGYIKGLINSVYAEA